MKKSLFSLLLLALLEYVGQDAIQANVFPIPPGDERLIEIEYTTLLTAAPGGRGK